MFRLLGRGDRGDDPHCKEPIFNISLREFIKASKGLFKVAGHPDSSLLMQTYVGKGFLLGHYGLAMHVPAVKAELCLAPELSTKLHEMLCTIRTVKTGPEQNKLKASAHRLPRLEPWMFIVAKATPTLLNLILNRNIRRHEAITGRGERGDGRDLRPSSLVLKCPHCGLDRDCAKVSIYASKARCINCAACKRNTTSTRWLCSHEIPWHLCAEHRKLGFRCGAYHSQQGLQLKRPDPLKLEARLQAKTRKLGRLGQDEEPLCSTPPSISRALNSASCFSFNNKKSDEMRYGDRIPPKGDARGSSWAWQAHSTGQGSCDNPMDSSQHNKQTERVQVLCVDGSIGNSFHSQNRVQEPQCTFEGNSPKRRPRITRVQHAKSCKGLCPKVWTIDQYCPACHG